MLPYISAMMLAMTSSFALAADFEASQIPTDMIFKQGLTQVGLDQALAQVKAGDVIVLGEQHGTQDQALQQTYIIESIKKKGLKVSVGMEFFSFTDQPLVDQWRVGKISEADFLAKIGWGNGFPFDAYRRQVTSVGAGEFLLALNSPRSLTGKVAKSGLGSLTNEEIALLPPGLQVGNSKYLKRFKEAIGHVSDPQKIENYFMAQSIWDDTMAWRAGEFIKAHPDQVLVVIVGEFHVQYGGGLPDRMRARRLPKVLSFSLVNLEGLSETEQEQSVRPSAEYGPRADFVWTSRILSH